MIQISHLPNRRHAILRDFAGLTRRQLHQRVIAFFCYQLGCSASRAHHLRAFARLQFDVVDGRARRNIFQRQGISHQNVSLRPAHNFLSDLQSIGLKDVALLAVGVRQQRNPRRAVRIVLNRGNCRRNANFVALEINDAQFPLVSAAAMPTGDVA